ncbi:cuticle protein AM1274-like [Panulirus ornatus]|uniref:cuticle protein AM1274-like n=1 Tax=Panulirus ornatus TaxID=150431 RepID=UPI003A8690C6
MKLMILSCLAVVTVAGPQFHFTSPRHIAILRDNRFNDDNGNFQYEFETENGIYENVVGRPGRSGGQTMDGSFRFPLPNGIIADFQFVADENGYQVRSPVIPTPHPLPAHAAEQVALTEQLRARGARWDEQGRRIARSAGY